MVDVLLFLVVRSLVVVVVVVEGGGVDEKGVTVVGGVSDDCSVDFHHATVGQSLAIEDKFVDKKNGHRLFHDKKF